MYTKLKDSFSFLEAATAVKLLSTAIEWDMYAPTANGRRTDAFVFQCRLAHSFTWVAVATVTQASMATAVIVCDPGIRGNVTVRVCPRRVNEWMLFTHISCECRTGMRQARRNALYPLWNVKSSRSLRWTTCHNCGYSVDAGSSIVVVVVLGLVWNASVR